MTTTIAALVLGYLIGWYVRSDAERAEKRAEARRMLDGIVKGGAYNAH